MKLRMFRVDAFAERVFARNPVAVCPLEALSIPDGDMPNLK
ncbi:hypothetical protein SAMN05216210_0431 [Halopseudomonas salegens]|uniref:Uncharacterized protein n=1 Tax=Halopseudomonas salegens TaxID=1434072 RepID=A0A1H2E7M3_9GAMM|nr:hypothetical protein SAMN05216210_0431 [Halopseudomonas salegens]